MSDESVVLNGRYRLERQIGRGGFALVFLGTDLLLKRRVAVKVLHRDLVESAAEGNFLERFEREAQAVAALDHPNILAVHDYGRAEGTAFLVMPFVEGGTLHDKLRREQRWSLGRTGDYLRQAAAALDYAHGRNIVHRDVKPHNMLLRDHDAHLLLADFGIARVLGQGTTRTTTLVGTIPYMAPEQFDGQVGFASDVYALGCVLFQLLTGDPPYSGTTQEIIRGHLLAPVPSLRERGQGLMVPALQPVLDRALAKQPDARFRSPGELSKAFGAAILAGDPAAVPETVVLHALPALDGTATAERPPAVPLTGGGGATAAGPATAPPDPTHVPDAPDPVVTAGVVATTAPAPRTTQLPAPVPPSGVEPRRGRPVALLAGVGAMLALLTMLLVALGIVATTRSRTVTGGTVGPATPAAVSGTVATVALPPTPMPVSPTEPAGTVAVIIPATVAPLATTLPNASPGPAATPMPTTGATSTTARQTSPSATVASTGTRTPLQPFATLTGHTDDVRAVSWSPNGRVLATGSGDGTVRLWARDGTLLVTRRDHTELVQAVAWSPDGNTLASGSGDGTVRLWGADGTPRAELRGHNGGVTGVSWSPNGDALASSSWDLTVRLWSATGTALGSLTGHTGFVQAVAWAPGGTRLASASWDGTVRLWSRDGRTLAILTGHTDKVWAVAWAPDSATLASGSADRTVRLWSAEGQPLATLNGHTREVTSVAWAPDGKGLASGSYDGTVRLWSADGRSVAQPFGHGDIVTSVAWSPDGTMLASASWDDTVRLLR